MSSQKISRRSFLKAASMAGIGAGLMRGLPSFASAAFQDKIDMSLWWWADDPAYGKWVEDTAKKFGEQNAGITISTLQQDTCCVISQFTTAAAAGETQPRVKPPMCNFSSTAFTTSKMSGKVI